MAKKQLNPNIRCCKDLENRNSFKQDLFQRLECLLKMKNNIVISKMLIFIIPVMALISLGCEKEILSTVTHESSRERVLQTEEQKMQNGIEYNDVIVENEYSEDKPKNIIFQSSTPDLTTARVILENAKIQDDIITLTLSYSGGCRPHEFDLAYTTFEETNPIQVSVWILHHKNDDPCDQWVTETRAFNLSPLKEHFFEMYDSPCGPIILNIFNSSEPQTAFSLSFDYCSDNAPLTPGPPLPPVYEDVNQF